jgi:hypothetical protein
VEGEGEGEGRVLKGRGRRGKERERDEYKEEEGGQKICFPDSVPGCFFFLIFRLGAMFLYGEYCFLMDHDEGYHFTTTAASKLEIIPTATPSLNSVNISYLLFSARASTFFFFFEFYIFTWSFFFFLF